MAPRSSPPPPLPCSSSHYPLPAAAPRPRLFAAPVPVPGGPRTPLVPALFVIGDSTADVGTNNYLGTLARAYREPYGRDFDTRRPTGRFSNGRIPVGYIGAERLGLPFVPPYLEQNIRMGVGSIDLSNIDGMIQGVNYSSAAAGILSSSGSELGMHMSLSQQVQQVDDTYGQLSLALGEAATTDLFRKSVFFVPIGSNDFIHYYLRNVSGVQMRYLPWEFNQLLVNAMRQEIKNLYNINVWKVIMMGLPPVGCAPHFLWEYGSQDGECIGYINDIVIQAVTSCSALHGQFTKCSLAHDPKNKKKRKEKLQPPSTCPLITINPSADLLAYNNLIAGSDADLQ